MKNLFILFMFTLMGGVALSAANSVENLPILSSDFELEIQEVPTSISDFVVEVECEVTYSGSIGISGSSVSFKCTGKGKGDTAKEACEEATMVAAECVKQQFGL